MGLTVPPPPYCTGKYRRCNYCQTNFGADRHNCPNCGAFGYTEFAVPDAPQAKPLQPRSDNTRP